MIKDELQNLYNNKCLILMKILIINFINIIKYR